MREQERKGAEKRCDDGTGGKKMDIFPAKILNAPQGLILHRREHSN